jgi:hypothetical protein
MAEPEIARFQCLVGVCSVLERKSLVDANAHLPRGAHLEQLVRGGFECIVSLRVAEEEWARQKQRALLRQQNGCNGTGGLPGSDLPPPGAAAPDSTRAHRHRPLSSSRPRERSSAEFASHEAYRFPRKHVPPDILMQGRKFHKFIIITIMLRFEHGIDIRPENASVDPPCSGIYAPSQGSPRPGPSAVHKAKSPFDTTAPTRAAQALPSRDLHQCPARVRAWSLPPSDRFPAKKEDVGRPRAR